ncbi:3-deoxy-7-phosphoheptulonate synthase [Streptomyces sp. NBC_00076]
MNGPWYWKTRAARPADPPSSAGLGERTRQPDGAHVRPRSSCTHLKPEPTVSSEDAVTQSRTLYPEGVPGRLTFIIRLGAKDVHRTCHRSSTRRP